MGRPETSPRQPSQGRALSHHRDNAQARCSCPHFTISISSEAVEQMASCEQGEGGTGEMLHVNKTAKHSCCDLAAVGKGY